jgi:hypothetical protein
MGHSGWGFYALLAVGSALAVPVVFFTLPETRGISLERVDELFDAANGPVWRRGARIRARGGAELQIAPALICEPCAEEPEASCAEHGKSGASADGM